MRFDTKRSEIGELLYRLKFNSDRRVVTQIVDAVEKFMESWKPHVDVIVPVPPSSSRAIQPVLVLAEAISERLCIPLADCVKRTREVPQLKNVYDFDERLRLLGGLHKIEPFGTEGKKILLFDDLYRSGATMNSITDALYDQGGAADVFALTITRTRSHR